jgi:formylglycine-generating enzyme
MNRNRLAAALLFAILLFIELGGERLPADAARTCGATDDQLLVPGGAVRIGTTHGYPDEAPSYEVTIEPFWIDRHEVTNRQYAAFVAATGHRTAAERAGGSIVFEPPGADQPAGGPADWWRYVEGADWRHPEGPASGLAGRDDLPVVHIAYADALAYARWRGRSLPTEEQFEHAARAGSAESTAPPAPNRANVWQGDFPRTNSRIDGHAALAPVGCYEANGFGLDDMIGNAWEWTGR